MNRCAKYALGSEHNPVGVDIQALMSAIKQAKFSSEQKDQWIERLRKTHEAQRELLFGMLHGIYSDPSSSEEARLNALFISSEFVSDFTPKVKSNLIDLHSEYLAKGDSKRHKASQKFFEKLRIISLLTESEQHSLFSNACKQLMSVHQGIDNFYNEPPFAERLAHLTSQGAVPDTAKNELVSAVITCAVGNGYGVSHAASPHYTKMIQNFSPREIEIMLNLPKSNSIVARRIGAYLLIPTISDTNYD